MNLLHVGVSMIFLASETMWIINAKVHIQHLLNVIYNHSYCFYHYYCHSFLTYIQFCQVTSGKLMNAIADWAGHRVLASP